MSKTSVLTETKTIEVRFHVCLGGSASFLKCSDGFLVNILVRKPHGNYLESEIISKEELLELVNGLTDLLK